MVPWGSHEEASKSPHSTVSCAWVAAVLIQPVTLQEVLWHEVFWRCAEGSPEKASVVSQCSVPAGLSSPWNTPSAKGSSLEDGSDNGFDLGSCPKPCFFTFFPRLVVVTRH